MITRRGFMGAAAILPLSACLGPASRRDGAQLRVVTFNIWHDREWAARQPLLVEALRETNADVIALQEVLQDSSKGLPNQAETLAEALGGYSVHFTSTTPEGEPRRYGNAILTRLPVVEVASKKLEPLSDYRTALRVRVQVEGGPVDVVVTHLAWKPEEAPLRAQQIADLMAWLPRERVPLVLLGDFNAELADPGLASLTSGRFHIARLPTSVTSTLNPAEGHAPRIIDHIFADSSLPGVSDARLIGHEPIGDVYPSDHFGVAATIFLDPSRDSR